MRSAKVKEPEIGTTGMPPAMKRFSACTRIPMEAREISQGCGLHSLGPAAEKALACVSTNPGKWYQAFS